MKRLSTIAGRTLSIKSKTTTTVTKNIEITEKIINNCPDKIANLSYSAYMDNPELERRLWDNEVDVDDLLPPSKVKPTDSSKLKNDKTKQK